MSDIQAMQAEVQSLSATVEQLLGVYGKATQRMGVVEKSVVRMKLAFRKNPLVKTIGNVALMAKGFTDLSKRVAHSTLMSRDEKDAMDKKMTVMQKLTKNLFLFGGVAKMNNKILLVANNRFTRMATRLFSLLSIFAIVAFALVAFSIAVDGANTPLLGMTENAGVLHDVIQGLVLILTGEGDEEGAAAAFDILAASVVTAAIAFTVFSGPVALVIGAATAAVGVFQLVKAETGNMTASIMAGVASFSALVGVGLMLKLMFTNLIGATSTAIVGSVGAILAGMGLIIGGIVAVVAYAKGAGEGIKGTILGVLGAIAIGIGLFLVGALAAVPAAIAAVVIFIVATVVRNWDAIKATLAAGWNWLKSTGMAVGSFFGRGMTAIFTFRRNLIQGLMGMLTTAGSNIRKWLSNLARNIGVWLVERKNQLIALPGTITKGFLTAMKNMLNAIIGVYNDFAAGVRFDIPENVPKIGGMVFELPTVPMLAKGGVVSKPTLAMIGEDGPEAVVPLSSKNNPGGIGLGGDVTVNINVAGVTDRTDKKELAREIGDLIRSEMTRSGRSFGNRRSAV